MVPGPVALLAAALQLLPLPLQFPLLLCFACLGTIWRLTDFLLWHQTLGILGSVSTAKMTCVNQCQAKLDCPGGYTRMSAGISSSPALDHPSACVTPLQTELSACREAAGDGEHYFYVSAAHRGGMDMVLKEHSCGSAHTEVFLCRRNVWVLLPLCFWSADRYGRQNTASCSGGKGFIWALSSGRTWVSVPAGCSADCPQSLHPGFIPGVEWPILGKSGWGWTLLHPVPKRMIPDPAQSKRSTKPLAISQTGCQRCSGREGGLDGFLGVECSLLCELRAREDFGCSQTACV